MRACGGLAVMTTLMGAVAVCGQRKMVQEPGSTVVASWVGMSRRWSSALWEKVKRTLVLGSWLLAQTKLI